MEHLRDVVSASTGHLLLCSPYISTPALDTVAEALPPAVDTVEVWTRLETRDWLTGVSDPEGLLDFMAQIHEKVGAVLIREAENLHAKIIISDGSTAMAGSANLTRGGFETNLEASRVVTGDEVHELRVVVDAIRPQLDSVSQEQFERFVAQCTAKLDSQEALLDLIRQEMPQPEFGPGSLQPYGDFLAFLEEYEGPLAADLLGIARNLDGNNNTGKVKQAYFGIQRFLQEYPNHRDFVRGLPDHAWFEVQNSQLMPDWEQFLADYAEEVNEAYQYSIPTLRGYLTAASGGTLTGGGGGDNQFKRAWPLVGRALAD